MICPISHGIYTSIEINVISEKGLSAGGATLTFTANFVWTTKSKSRLLDHNFKKWYGHVLRRDGVVRIIKKRLNLVMEL